MTFELSLSMPADARFTAMLRDLAMHGAKQAGRSDVEARAFGRKVEQAARDVLADAPGGVYIPVTVRCTEGPVEVTIGSCCVSTTR